MRARYYGMTESEGNALLAKHAPRWPEHLADAHVIDRVLDAVAIAADYLRTRRNAYTRAAQSGKQPR